MIHEKYMQRCLELAAMGNGNVAPNPMVGAVLVYKDTIIGEGHHEQYGEGHGEVNALASVLPENRQFIPESTLYVNLEPCSHYGKTPPCSDLVIAQKIPKVVIACTDPNPQVAGRGIAKLEAAGVEIIRPCLEEKAIELNRRFFTFQSKKRPYIVLKWAQSKDGFMAKKTGEPVWISNALSKRLTHRWRSEESAIMVGRRTAELDNPQLNVRHWTGNSPLRIALDRAKKLPQNLHLFDGNIPTLIFTDKESLKNSTEINKENITYQTIDFSEPILPQILHHLHEQNVLSVLVEGGPKLLNSFIDLNLWDEARIFTGSGFLGDGLAAPNVPVLPNSEEPLSDNLLTTYRNK